MHVCLREVKNSLFFLQALLFTAFLATVLKILTYALVSTWSSVSSGWEHVKRKMHPCPQQAFNPCKFRAALKYSLNDDWRKDCKRNRMPQKSRLDLKFSVKPTAYSTHTGRHDGSSWFSRQPLWWEKYDGGISSKSAYLQHYLCPKNNFLPDCFSLTLSLSNKPNRCFLCHTVDTSVFINF